MLDIRMIGLGLVVGFIVATAVPPNAQEAGWVGNTETEKADKSRLEEVYFVNARGLNFRPGPTLDNEPLTILHGGDFVRQLGQTFNDVERIVWYHVIKADGEDGWVSARYLTPVGESVAIVAGAARFLSQLETPTVASGMPAMDSIRAGFVYVGPVGDAGWTYQHDLGRKALEALPHVARTTFVEAVPEEDELVGAAIEKLVAEGSNVIFTTSYGYMDPTIEAAERHSNVVFMHCSGFKTAPNAGTYFGRMYEARYLAGVVAGGMTQSNLIGYVAAFPIPEVVRGINAFALGAQSVNPDVEVAVRWTESWYGPSLEREKAGELLDQGADVLTIHQDSPAALQVTEQRGKLAIGYHSDMNAFASAATLTSAMWDWGVMYRHLAEQLRKGNWQPDQLWWGLKEGVVGLAPLSDLVPRDLADLVEQRRQQLVDDRLHIFAGPIRDASGQVRVSSGQLMSDADLLTMDFFVRGVSGELEVSAPTPTEIN